MTDPSQDRGLRRVLIVAREFPPGGGAPAIRIAKLVKYLPAFGWQVTVVTAPADHAFQRDERLAEDLPADLDVHRIPRLFARTIHPDRWATHGTVQSAPPSRLGRLLIPDSGILWAAPAARAVGRVIGGFDAILTSAPPFSTHLVGLWAAYRHSVAWVADYRDNWTTSPFYDSRGPSRLLAVALERRILRQAEVITVVSDAAAREIGLAFAVDPDRLHVAMNGFDPDDLPADRPPARTFEITYMGSMTHRRGPGPFLEAVERASIVRSELRRDVRIRLIGSVPDWAIGAAIRTVGAERVTVDGILSHRDALAKAADAAVLLGISSTAEAGGSALTSKLFEYLALRRPVLMLAPPGPAIEIVTAANAGEVADPDDPEAIRDALVRLYDGWASGAEQRVPDEVLQRFTRRRTAAAVARALDLAVQRRADRPTKIGRRPAMQSG